MNLIRVHAGRDYQVIFKLPLIAIVGQVNAGIDVFVFDLFVGRNVRPPFVRVIADKIIDDTGECV